MVVVPKPHGGIHVTVDLTKLNKYTNHLYFPLHTPCDVMSKIRPGQKFFFTLEGYYQLPLLEEFRDLTCFAAPWGC